MVGLPQTAGAEDILPNRVERIRSAWSRPQRKRPSKRPTVSRRDREPAPERAVKSARKRSRKSARQWVAMAATALPPAWSAKPVTPQPSKPGTSPLGTVDPGRVSHRTRLSAMPKASAICLAKLRAWRVPFRLAKPHFGIRTPVILTGPVGGVYYVNRWMPKKPPLMDCLLALTLAKASRTLNRFGVKKLYFTSTYRKGRRGDPRPSRHALGLAIDVRDIELHNGTRYNVLKDWKKYYGGPSNCVGRVPSHRAMLLRRLVCSLEERNAFRRILSPDSDIAHRDHFHMAAGKAGERWKRARWAGRLLYQPLPKTRRFPSWYRWYRCYKYLSWRARKRCYRRRRPSWVGSGNPYCFKPRVRLRYLRGVRLYKIKRRQLASTAKSPAVPPAPTPVPKSPAKP